MIENTVEVIKEVSNIENNLLTNSKGQTLYIGIRFNSEVFKTQSPPISEKLLLIKTVWRLIDGKHECFDDKYKGKRPNSIFIQDNNGTLLYDSSNTHEMSANKSALKKDNNSSVKTFASLSESEKEKVIDITVEQINTNIDKPKPSNNPWDELDFLK